MRNEREDNRLNPLISIIIPTYNSEYYLEECLDSIVTQNFNNIEIICVNDASCDNSLEILKRYAENDTRFKIIENEKNSGTSISRNKAIDIAQGKYMFFLDSDDKIEIDTLEKLYTFAEKYDFDFVTINVKRFDEEKIWNSILHEIAIGNETLINANILEHPKLIYDTISCNKFYKRSFIIENNFKFEEGRLYEDILFSAQLYCSDAKIGICPNINYYWRVRTKGNKSFTQTLNNSKNIIDRAHAIKKEIDFLKDTKYEKLLEELYIKVLKIDFLQFINQIPLYDDNYIKNISENFSPILKSFPKDSFNQINEIDKLKYELIMNNDLESLIFLFKHEKEHEEKITYLNNEISSKNSKLNESTQNINSLNHKIEKLNKNNHKITNDYNQLNERYEKIKTENNKLKKENEKISEINKKQKNEIKIIKSTKGWFKYKIKNLYERFIKN